MGADCNHGTHVAGIIAGRGNNFSGVAKDANIIAIQVFTRFNTTEVCKDAPVPCLLSSPSDQIKGLERVLNLASSYNIAAVNMSLGGEKFTSPCDSFNPALKAAIDNLRSKGIATIISSGNKEYTDAISSPACISSAISVGSIGDGSFGAGRDRVSSFSNSASFLNLLAPGEWINSSIPGGGYQNFHGTSMAAPHVAGAWAILKSKSLTATVDQILAALTNTGVPVTDFRNGIVKPRIQVDAAVIALSGGGGGNVAQYSSGTTITLTANANPGFVFVKWQMDGADFSTSPAVNLLMNSNRTLTAVFRVGSGDAPIINSVTYDGKKRVAIVGSKFGSAPRVLINNLDLTDWLTGFSDTSINLKGKAKKLGLKTGDNSIQIIDSNGRASNIFTLSL